MTTKVTVDTHTGWPVEVTMKDRWVVNGVEQTREQKVTVPPHSTRDFHLTSTRQLEFKELEIEPPTPKSVPA